MKKQVIVCVILLLVLGSAKAQESNIIEFTPSKLLKKGQVDFKLFNNLYTENKWIGADSTKTELPRRYFLTHTFEVSYGISKSRRLNIGLIANIKSNVFNPDFSEPYGIGDLFTYSSRDSVSRAGLTTIAPTIKFAPFKNVGNFSIQSSLFIPLFEYEQKDDVYLDRKSFAWENRFFFDKTFKGKYQIFAELNLTYFTGDSISFDNVEAGSYSGGFANNSLATPVSFFFSYFPNQKMTFYAMSQHYQLFDLGNNFEQNFTQSGVGFKYQLTEDLNLEILYTNFWRASLFTGLGETYNFGLRYLLK